MATNYQVRLEYPFPPNNNAQLAQAWNEAANQIEAENPHELNEGVTECFAEATAVTDKQEDLVKEKMEEYMSIVDDRSVPYDQCVIKGWKLIMEISNYIRCCAALGDLDGEMHGLKVLMDFMAGESDA
jgi:hypothetical protein